MRFIITMLLLHLLAELNAQGYISYFTGDTTDIQVNSTPGCVLAGGAGDHDNAMIWMLERANGGDVLVLRASGSDGYNDYFYSDLGVEVNSVETIVFTNSLASSNAYVLQQIGNAECIFLAGGDQWNYISFWKDSPVEMALQAFVDDGGVIGGTSAGMAVLGGNYFSAQNGTVSTAAALANPYNEDVALGFQDFLQIPFVSDVVTDTHYDNPDRRGRHVTFMARIRTDYGVVSKGIACEEWVAVAIDENGLAHCFGEYPDYDEQAYFIQPFCGLTSAPEVCLPDQNLNWSNNEQALLVYKANATLEGDATFSLVDWQTTSGSGEWSFWWVNNGSLQVTPITSYQDCSTSISNDLANDPSLIYVPNIHSVLVKNATKFCLWDLQGKLLLEKGITGPMESVEIPVPANRTLICTVWSEDQMKSIVIPLVE